MKPSKLVDQSTRKRMARQKKAAKERQSLSSLKKALNYEADVPRCAACVEFRKPGFVLINSIPRGVPARCKRHQFNCHVNGLCDTWKSATGEILEDNPLDQTGDSNAP